MSESELLDRRERRQAATGEGMAALGQAEDLSIKTNQNKGNDYYRNKGDTTSFDEGLMFSEGFEPSLVEVAEGQDPVEDMLIPNRYLKGNQRVIFGTDVSTGVKKAPMPQEKSMWDIPARIVVGGLHDAAKGALNLQKDVSGGLGLPLDPFEDVRDLALRLQEPKWLRESAGWGEDMARGIAQYGWGYGAATKIIGGLSLGGMLPREIAKAAVSGQSFDPAEGNIGTLMDEMGVLPDFLQAMDSKATTEQHGRLQGRLSMALEEFGLGVGAGAAGSIIKQAQRQYRAYGSSMMDEGIQKYTHSTGASVHPTNGVGADIAIDQKGMEDAVDMIASGFQITGGTADDFADMAAKSGINKNLATKAWNNASKEKMGRIAEYMSQGPKTKMTRQRGSIDFGEVVLDRKYSHTLTHSVAQDALRPDQAYAVNDIKQFFDKRVSRGQIEKAEYVNTVEPLIKEMKAEGHKSITGAQLAAKMQIEQPEFKTVSRTGRDSHHYGYTDEANTYSNDDYYSPDDVMYEEHLFLSRNKRTEGEGGFVNSVHYSEPDVKATVRTTLFDAPDASAAGKDMSEYGMASMVDDLFDAQDSDAILRTLDHHGYRHLFDADDIEFAVGRNGAGDEVFGPTTGGTGDRADYLTRALRAEEKRARLAGEGPERPLVDSINIVELQSDQASFARKNGTLDDDALHDVATQIMGVEDIDELDAILKANTKLTGESLRRASDRLAANYDRGEAAVKEHLRNIVPAPSVFNEDRAWVRQAIRPVIDKALDNGVSTIKLDSREQVANRFSGGDLETGANHLYQGKYPKILKQYFLEIGVPEENIHMPKNARDNFTVKLPDEMFEGDKPSLPLYSITGAAPVTLLGEKDDSQ